ncbi:MAG: F0F1 ATP synthase subunit B [Gallionella sp.]|nr:F0F1 ATP synthase subunit B [Gallionella sp.]
MDITFTLIAQALMFAILIWFTAKFIWPPLMTAIENRQKTIADGLAAAERGKHDLDLAAKRSAELLREAKEKAADILAGGDKRASEIVEAAKIQAKVEADRIVAGAVAEIEQETFRAKEQLRSHVSAIALAGAGRILGREIDAKAHNDMLDKLVAGM